MARHAAAARGRLGQRRHLDPALREQNDEPRRRPDGTPAGCDECQQDAGALGRVLNVLTAENDELRRRANQARELSSPG